jgi:hypothetical protein
VSNDNVSVQRSLGRIEGQLAAMQKTLEEHTKADAENFAALAAKLDAIDVPGAVRRIAWRWAAGIGAVVAFVAQVAQALGWLP